MKEYLIIINLISFIITFIDKRKAIKNKWRIRENTFLFLSIIGGSIGVILGMKAFHHKTKKPEFYIGIPLILTIQIYLYIKYFL